jgi:hypothetical protein
MVKWNRHYLQPLLIAGRFAAAFRFPSGYRDQHSYVIKISLTA